MKITQVVLAAVARFFMPISFLVAVCVAPKTMLPIWRTWPSMWRDMWDDPL